MFGRARFFQKMFLLADLSIEIVLRVLFFTFRNANIKFAQKEFIWRFYFTAKAPPTIKQVEIINRKKFANMALDEHIEAFIVYITSLAIMSLYLVRKTQMVLLVNKELQSPFKYSDFSDVFLEKKALVLPKTSNLNQYVIKLQDGQQPFYESIYSLGLVELKRLKTYIKTNLANSFI